VDFEGRAWGRGRSKDGENDRTTASLIINCQDRFGVSGRPGAHEKRPFTMKLFGFYTKNTYTRRAHVCAACKSGQSEHYSHILYVYTNDIIYIYDIYLNVCVSVCVCVHACVNEIHSY
jgi:hypothetical protein